MGKWYWVLTNRTCPECGGVFRNWNGEQNDYHTIVCGAKYIEEEYTKFPKEEVIEWVNHTK